MVFIRRDAQGWGRTGDYFTNVSVGPAYGQLLAEQFAEAWKILGEPEDFVIVEQGAHEGEFARDVLDRLHVEHPELFPTLRYRVIEPSAVLRQRQCEALNLYEGKIEWFDSLDSVESFDGIHFSNELIDAFPVYLVTRGENPSRWLERRVGLDGGEFVFVTRELTDAGLLACANKLPERKGPYETEVHPGALQWMRGLSGKLRRGFVMTVDYGLSREDYYAEERKLGTLQVRRDQRLLDSPLAAVGEADLTSHVEWTSLIEEARNSGFTFEGLADQYHFLTGILAEHADFLENASPKIRRELQTLLHPEMLGRSFQVLVLSRGLSPSPKLSGLHFQRHSRSGAPEE